MKRSIYFRNFLATALIVLISFAILGGLFSAWMYSRSVSENSATMETALLAASRYVTTQYIYSEVELSDLDVSMLLSLVSDVTGFDLLITNPNGIVYACSKKDFLNIGKQVPSYALTLASEHPRSVTRTSLDTIYSETRQVAGMPLTRGENGESIVFGYIFLSNDMTVFKETWQRFSGVFVLIALNVMVLTFAISFYATKKQSAPLNEMVSAARRFARGDISVRVRPSDRIDEIGQLTQAFNAMADSLESSETSRRNFIANLSHELKTPMTIIAGFAEGLLDGTIRPENGERYLGVIASETRRLARLVGGMLDMSKLQSTDKEDVLKNSFDITEVAKLALLSLSGKIEERRLDVNAELPEDAIMTQGDKDSITQVIYNLIDNAIKYSKPGGIISLRLWKQSGRAYISVENSGKTIPEDELPQIFERFHKTDKSRSIDREGVGLGLYIVKTILDNHNEDIFVTSADGMTRFMFTLTIA